MKIYSSPKDTIALQNNERLAEEARQKFLKEHERMESESARSAASPKEEKKKEAKATAKKEGKKKNKKKF